MTSLITSMLVAHIVLGLVGLAAAHFAYMQFIRRTPPYRLISVAAWIGALAFLASWGTGAYYYVVHYGSAVKPRILNSEYPWAHQFFMEAKEHVFILIPFLTIVFALVSLSLRMHDDLRLKRAAAWLAALVVILGAFVAGSGILISGAVR